MGAFAKAPTYAETCCPGESPRFGSAKPPPFGKGGFGGDFLLFQELYQLDNHRGGKGKACHLGEVCHAEGRGHQEQCVKTRDKQHGQQEHHAGKEGVEGIGVGEKPQAEDGGGRKLTHQPAQMITFSELWAVPLAISCFYGIVCC